MFSKFIVMTAAFLPSLAFAADFPVGSAKTPISPPPAFTWGGLYVGGQLGYDESRDRYTTRIPVTGASLAGVSANPLKGAMGGMHLGYNVTRDLLPFLGAGTGGSGVVLGFDGDFDLSAVREQYQVGAVTVTGCDDVQGSIRGRLGYAFNRTLFYATGGAAFAGIDNAYQNAATNSIANIYHNRIGYTIGAGIEYAVTNHWVLRAEYRYTDYGSYSDIPALSANRSVAFTHANSQNRVLGGFSYKFDPDYVFPAAVSASRVAAKY